MSSITLDRWLARVEQAHPARIDLGLERVSAIAKILALTDYTCPVITVAGTNGKGSCIALAEQIALAAGYRVASYSSPHVLQFSERVRLNGQMVTDDALCRAFAAIAEVSDGVALTYFEYITLAALYLFKQTPVDLILLEVGLGGRLDAVNVVDADVAIIASIGLDHTDYLGNDREAIGREKAGILRSGKPAVCGDLAPPDSLLQHAEQLGAPIYCRGGDFDYQYDDGHWTFTSGQQTLTDLPQPAILLPNAATVLMALSLLGDHFTFSQEAIKQGLQQVSLPGRFQIIAGPVCHVFDVAHNPDSTQALAHNLQQLKPQQQTYAVWSMLADKDLVGTVRALEGLIDAWFAAPLSVPRAATTQQLTQALQDNDITRFWLDDDITTAYQRVLDEAQPGDHIVIFGSFHTVAPVLALVV